jgi:hypothetical protein
MKEAVGKENRKATHKAGVKTKRHWINGHEKTRPAFAWLHAAKSGCSREPVHLFRRSPRVVA